MQALLADILRIVKASGATRAKVDVEGLKLEVEFPSEGPEALDPLAPTTPRVSFRKPAFKTE